MTDRSPLCTVKQCPHWQAECPFGQRAIQLHDADKPFTIHTTPRPDCIWPEEKKETKQ